MDDQHPIQNVPDLVDFVCGALNPQLRRHLHTARTSDLEEPCHRFDVVVIDPQRWTMMPRPNCVEGRRAAIGCLLIQLVVQCIVDDASAPQASHLVTEMLDASRDFSGRTFQGNLRDGWL